MRVTVEHGPNAGDDIGNISTRKEARNASAGTEARLERSLAVCPKETT